MSLTTIHKCTGIVAMVNAQPYYIDVEENPNPGYHGVAIRYTLQAKTDMLITDFGFLNSTHLDNEPIHVLLENLTTGSFSDYYTQVTTDESLGTEGVFRFTTPLPLAKQVRENDILRITIFAIHHLGLGVVQQEEVKSYNILPLGSDVGIIPESVNPDNWEEFEPYLIAQEDVNFCVRLHGLCGIHNPNELNDASGNVNYLAVGLGVLFGLTVGYLVGDILRKKL